MINLQDALEKYKTTVLNIGVIVLALFIAFKIFSTQSAEVASLEQEKEKELKKKAVLKKIEQMNKEVEAYRHYINNKDINEVIYILGDLAKRSLVDIVSVRPSTEEKRPNFTKYLFELKISSASYHDIGNFLAALENDPSIFVVESLNMIHSRKGGESAAEMISADLRISTILTNQ